MHIQVMLLLCVAWANQRNCLSNIMVFVVLFLFD